MAPPLQESRLPGGRRMQTIAMSNVRSQAAAVRTLLDELERHSDPGLAQQLGEEVRRLGDLLGRVASTLDRAAGRR